MQLGHPPIRTLQTQGFPGHDNEMGPTYNITIYLCTNFSSIILHGHSTLKSMLSEGDKLTRCAAMLPSWPAGSLQLPTFSSSKNEGTTEVLS